jgi:hypothetical protein
MTPTVDQAIEIIRRLPPPEREKVRDWLERESENESDKVYEADKRRERFRRSMRWIQENREKFDGQWVALDGDGRKVHAEAQSKSIKTPLMHRVSIKETEPFGGW